MGNQMEIPTPAELRAKRIQMGLKQADVARMAGISQSMVARIEAGRGEPGGNTAAKIVNVPPGTEKSGGKPAHRQRSPAFLV